MNHPEDNAEPLTLQEHTKRESGVMKRILLAGLGLIVLGCLAIGWWNWSAAREWRQLKAELEARGESFDLTAMLPPAPAEAENFCAIPALKDLPLVVDGDPDKGEPAARRKAFISLGNSSGGRPSWPAGPTLGQPTDLVPWMEYFRTTGMLKLPPDSGRPGADLLLAMDGTVPVIKELAAASSRQAAQFTPTPAVRTWSKWLVTEKWPHLNAAQNAANLLRLRAIAAAHAGDGAATLESVLAMSKLSEALSQEPFLIAHLVSVTCRTLMVAALWEGLRLRVFSEQQLHMLQQDLARYDGRASLLYAMRTERLLGINSTQMLKAAREKGAQYAGTSGPLKFIGVMPAGWFDQNAACIVSLEQQHIITPLKEKNLGAAVLQSSVLNKRLQDMHERTLTEVAHALVVLIIPSLTVIVTKSAAVQSANSRALAAVVLERYFLRHGHYPKSLGDLIPEFLPAPPLDRMDASPLHYRQTADGRFMLWSCAFDGVDDGGTGPVDPDGVPVSNLTRVEYKGDWVWQYTPIQK